MNKDEKLKYINNFRKATYSQFNVDLKKEDKEEIDIFLKQHNISKAEFIRNAFKNLKEKNEKEGK